MNHAKSTQPIDKLAITLIILLTLVMGLLIWGGTTCKDKCLFHTGVRVNGFSWSDKTLGGQDRAFILTFNRPMDRLSVEENLTITPSLPGKISWSGLRLAYTLANPIPYGQTYQVTLAGAKDRFPNQKQTGALIKPFNAEFRSRDRVLAYIGTEGEEQGRLVLFNWTTQKKTILTPKKLAVFDFKPDPQGNFLLFSATDINQGIGGISYLKLYKVSTTLDSSSKTGSEIELVLDNQQYQNNKFDISQDGKTIVVQRLNRDNTEDYGLWKIADGQSSQIINNTQVGDFLITPDSQAVAASQGEGVALLPLKAEAEPVNFLPKFGQVLDFTADGMGAAMINYNTDSEELKYTRSLYYVNNQGIQKELLNTNGSIQNCQFDPTAKHLYCWLTELVKGELYIEKPYLAKINLKTAEIKTLVKVPKYQESQVSVAPDGLGILFERSLGDNSTNAPGIKKNVIWLAILDLERNSTANSNSSRIWLWLCNFPLENFVGVDILSYLKERDSN